MKSWMVFLECPRITFESLVFSRVLQTSSKEEELKEGESFKESYVTWQKEDSGDPDQLEDGHLRVLEAGPLVDHLHYAAGKQPKVGAGGPDLGPVGHEDGAGQVTDHPGAQVDDGDPRGARHLLQVAHQPELEGHRDQKVNDPRTRKNTKWCPRKTWSVTVSMDNQIRVGS